MIYRLHGSANSWRRLACCAALSLLVLGAGGCKKPGNTAAVHGRIQYRGEPLANAGITFFPQKGRPVTATAPQGDYSTELTPGEYTVVVAVGYELPKGFKEGDPVPPPKIVLPEEYTERTKSTLKASVKLGQDQPIDFDLK
jgi:hypothetical protein